MNSTVHIDDIKARMDRLVEFYAAHKIAVSRLTVFPADLHYLQTHPAEAYVNGFETRGAAVYFRDLELVAMREADAP